jgi:exonuclease SbcC
MIEKIELINFESHKNTKLDLVDGVNVVIGASDSGKSGCLRGVNWIVNNRPLGDDFRSLWGGKTSSSIVINSNKIERIRTDNDNLYVINDDYKHPFKAFGNDVPEEIKKMINFSDVNFQYQMDSPFLFSETSGEVAKYINQIINLEIIDNTLANIDKMKRDYTKKLENERVLLKSNQDELGQYACLEELDELVTKAEILDKKINEIEEKKESLISISEKIKNLKLAIKKIDGYLKIEKVLEKSMETNKKLDENKRKIDSLNGLINSINQCENAIIQNDNKFKVLEQEFLKIMPKECLNKNCVFLVE